MDVEEGDVAQTPKKQKMEEPDEITPSASVKGKNKIVKVRGPSFAIQEYTFSGVPKEAARKYKSKTELLEKYREAGKRAFEER